MQTSIRLVAGVDEAGRGPLAGPVVAAAVVVQKKLNLQNLRDSKQLSAKQREHYYGLFLKTPSIQWGIGRVGERMIDKINIYQATKLAMERAVASLSRKVRPDFLIIDGTMRIQTSIPQQCVIKGDETVTLCAIASIIAKVSRDRFMQKYHKLYPEYGFDRHKGYGTPNHLRALRGYGLSPIHRRSFEPCKEIAFMLE